MPRNPDNTLFGYPPRDPVLCPGPCRRLAEPFDGDTCWSCTQELKATAAKPLPANAGRVSAGRKPAGGKSRTHSVSPVYTPVTMGGR